MNVNSDYNCEVDNYNSRPNQKTNCCNCNPNHNTCQDCCEFISGNSIDIELHNGDCEVKADIVVSKKRSVRIWGQVKDCDDNPVPNVLVKLLKPIYCHGKLDYEGISHTISDCNGFYQFEICPCKEDKKYKIIVSQAAFGKERTLSDNMDNCNSCNTNNCY